MKRQCLAIFIMAFLCVFAFSSCQSAQKVHYLRHLNTTIEPVDKYTPEGVQGSSSDIFFHGNNPFSLSEAINSSSEQMESSISIAPGCQMSQCVDVGGALEVLAEQNAGDITVDNCQAILQDPDYISWGLGDIDCEQVLDAYNSNPDEAEEILRDELEAHDVTICEELPPCMDVSEFPSQAVFWLLMN